MTVHREEMETEEAVVLVRMQVKGNLHVRGTEGGTVRVESSGDAPHVTREAGTVEIQSDDSCVVDVPSHAPLTVETHGDLTVENVAGRIEIVRAKGNASLSNIGEIRAEKIYGDLRVAQAASVNIEQVHGNAHINDVGGAVSVNAKGDVNLRGANGPAAVNCKGNAHLSEINGERVSVNAKGDATLTQCRGEISANSAGNILLHTLASQRVRGVAKGDIRVDFSETTGGTAKIVTSGDLHIQKDETSVRRGRGIYKFRFGQGDTKLSLVSKGNVHLLGIDADESELKGISEDMGAWGEEFGAEIGEEMGAIGAELGTWGAEFGREFGREFGAVGRDIARQVQDKVQRKLRAKVKKMGKRAAKGEWKDSKSWSFNLDDIATPPTPPAAPSRDAPFDPVEEVEAGEPVSEEERGLVLRMLEEGKISASEAATLLEALGDGE